MKWTLANSNKDNNTDCLVLIEVSNNNTENRNTIIDNNNATYHTDSIKIISIINFKTKEKINTAHYHKNNDIVFNINNEIFYENAILEGECTDKGFEYFLNMKRVVNEMLDNKIYYYYQGDIFCKLSLIKVNKHKQIILL